MRSAPLMITATAAAAANLAGATLLGASLLGASLFGSSVVKAQGTHEATPSQQGCLPSATNKNENGATVGTADRRELSDKLAQANGVICPPETADNLRVKPPATGALKVVPPPGSPGGDPTVQPK
ncbi:MAG: hypothetical protein ACJ8F3_22240 [Xanthobacteraceae bacterium]